MQNHFRLQSPVAATIAIILAAVFGIATFAYATGTVITACAEKNGNIYLIGTGFRQAKCEKGDTPLSWNIQGLQGLQGPKGEKGDPGAQGLFGFVSSTTIVTNYATGLGQEGYIYVDVDCPQGALVLSGGGAISWQAPNHEAPKPDGTITASYPRSPSAWRVGAISNSPNAYLGAYALCAF